MLHQIQPTGKVLAATFLLSQHDGTERVATMLCDLVQAMNKEEMAEVKKYVKYGSFMAQEPLLDSTEQA